MDRPAARDAESCEPLTAVPRRKLCTRRRASWACLLLLLLLTTASGLGSWYMGRLVDAGVWDAAVVDRPGATGYGRFADSYTLFVVRFLNVSNAAEVLERGAKPKLVEVGPFVYKQYQSRKDIKFDSESDMVSYRQHTWSEFDKDETLARSNGVYHSDTDVKITTLNLIFSGMRTMTSQSALHMLGGLLWRSDFERLFEQRTPRELLEGYNVTFKLMGLPVHTVAFPGIAPNLPKAKDPNMLHTSAIHVGAHENDKTFSYMTWEGQSEARVQCPFGSLHLPFSHGCKAGQQPCCGQKELVPLWNTTQMPGEFDADANAVRGTTGEQFRRGLIEDVEEVEMYFSLVRRAMRLATTPGEQRRHQGIPVRTFRPDYGTFWANATERPANARYYQWGPSGLVNMSMALGADLYMSPAHFLGCDPSLSEAVEGLRPDPDKHGFLMGVEPTTGITLETYCTVMLSGRVHAEPDAPGTHGHGWFPALAGRTLYVPIAWFGLEVPDLPPEVVNVLLAMNMGQRMEIILRCACIGGSTALAVAMLIRSLCYVKVGCGRAAA